MNLTRSIRIILRDAEMGLGMASRYMRRIDGAVIVTYHGVEPRELISDPGIQSLHIDPLSLKKQVEFLARNFTMISGVDELPDAPRESGRPFALVTFDDGYKNFLTHALPVLEDVGVPSTLFVTANCIENGSRHPTYICRATIGNLEPGTYDLDSISETLTLTEENRIAAGMRMAERTKHLPWDKTRMLLTELESLFSEGDLRQLHARYSSDAPMSWQDVINVKNRGVRIGSHTLDHVVLGHEQSQDVIRQQVIESRQMIEDRVGECRLFAYPNGAAADICSEAVQAVDDAGYDYAFSTVPGVTAPKNLESNRLALPRLSISDNWNGFRKYVSTAWRHNRRHAAFLQSLQMVSK